MGLSETISHLSTTPDEQLQLRRIADKAEQCRRQNIPVWTKFLTPRERELAEQMMPLLGSPAHVYLGGTDNAERSVLYFLPDWLEDAPLDDDCPIAALRCTYPSEYGEAGHRDILGALMGLGIVRETVGDIYPSKGSVDIIVLRDIVSYVQQNFFSAGKVRLQVSVIPLSDIHTPELKQVQIRDTVASVRLDSIISSGFGMSRDKAATLIRSGRVSVDHTECTKPDRVLQQGSSITARGFGKLLLSEIGGLSKKGRIGVVLTKYVG